jgi:hypothetical protein
MTSRPGSGDPDRPRSPGFCYLYLCPTRIDVFTGTTGSQPVTYSDTNLSETAREIKQLIYDSTIYETDPEPLKGGAEWWAAQVGTSSLETPGALDELVAAGTLVKDGEGEGATYIYVPVTVVSPELHGRREPGQGEQ